MKEKPDWIKNYIKPVNTEIKHINGHWYLYERSSKYDPNTKKPKKISGPMIGKITEQGLMPKAVKISSVTDIESLEYGATQYFYENSAKMRDELKEAFPNEWKRIYSIALLRTVQGSRLKRLAMEYEESMISLVYPKLAMSGPSIASLYNYIGKHRSAVRDFLKGMRKEGKALLIDGHRILSASRNIETAELGYDSRHRFKPQLNVIYAFSVGEGTGCPEWFKNYAGSIPDVSAMEDFLNESGIDAASATVVADKGFASDLNLEVIRKCGMKYLVALDRGNMYAKHSVPVNESGYDGYFTYNERPILYKNLDSGDECRTYLFYDAALGSSELADLMARAEKKNATAFKAKEAEDKRRENDKGVLSDDEYALLKPVSLEELMAGHDELGTITLKTSRLGLGAVEAYLLYKQRQAIEVSFRTLDTELDGDSSYMQDKDSFEGWLFLNHLSLMLANDTIEHLKRKGLNSSYSFEDVRSYFRQIHATSINGNWIPNVRRSKIGKLCDKLGFDASVITLPIEHST
jgi:Transposase